MATKYRKQNKREKTVIRKLKYRNELKVRIEQKHHGKHSVPYQRNLKKEKKNRNMKVK